MYLGIDPGFSGALAVLSEKLDVIHYQDMPIIEVGNKRELNEPELRNILSKYSPHYTSLTAVSYTHLTLPTKA